MDWEFGGIQSFNYRIALSDNISDKQREQIFEQYGAATTETVAIEYEAADGTLVTNAIHINDSQGLVRVSGHDLVTYDITECDADDISIPREGDIFAPGALFATEKLCAANGWSTGSMVRWRPLGESEWQESPVTCINRDPQLQQFSMTRVAYEALGFSYKPDSVYTLDDLSEVAVEKIPGASSVTGLSSLRAQMSTMLQMIDAMIALFILIAAILGFVIIYNMGLLSLSEKAYHFATLKVLGFRHRRLVKIYTQQNIWLSVVGILLGLPAGFLFTDIMFKYAIGDSYDFFAMIDPSAYLIASLGTILIMLFTSLILARGLKKIDMVASLKANE